MYMKKIGSSIMLIILAAGCAMKEAPPLKVFTLKTVTPVRTSNSIYRNKVLKVAYPQMLKERMGNKMLFSYSDSEQGVYQNSEWSNTVPKLLQGSLVAMLGKSRIFKAVLPVSSTAGEDLRLESMIYDFSHHVRGEASYAAVSVQFSLIDSSTGRLLRTKQFSYKESTRTTDAEGYVEATNRAVEKLARDLVIWLRQ